MKSILYFIKKLLLLLVILIITDQLFGLLYMPVFYKQMRGKFFSTTYAIDKTTEEVLIFGNSHANEHFNAKLMQQKTGATVFNLGNQGQSILYYYPLMQSVLMHSKPRLIILNLDVYELTYNRDNYETLSIFLPYAGANKYVDSAINLSDHLGVYKSYSNLYKNNSTIGYTLLNLFGKSYNKSMASLGFDPQYGNICATVNKIAKVKKDGPVTFKTDSLKLRYLLTIIAELKKRQIPLLVTFTPLYGGQAYLKPNAVNSFNKLKTILAANNTTFVDMVADKQLANDCTKFYDPNHLNSIGADIFTNKIIAIINQNNYLKK